MFLFVNMGVACGNTSKNDDNKGEESSEQFEHTDHEMDGMDSEDSSQTTAFETDNGLFSIDLEWLVGPVTNQDNSLIVKIEGVDKPVKVETIEFLPWMTVHGHGTAIKDMTVSPYAHMGIEVDNAFIIENFYFVMGGPWDLKIKVTDDKGNIDSISIPVTVP